MAPNHDGQPIYRLIGVRDDFSEIILLEGATPGDIGSVRQALADDTEFVRFRMERMAQPEPV